MKIERIDPFLLEWAPHGAIAMATESVGIVILALDAESLLTSTEVAWKRLKSPAEVTSRVICMSYGPLFKSRNGKSILTMVLQTGEALIIEELTNGVECVHKSSPLFTSATWFDGKALFGTETGIISWIDTKTFSIHEWSTLPVERKVLELTSTSSTVAAVLSDNSCWVKSESSEWTQILEPGTKPIHSIKFTLNQDSLFVYQSEQVITVDFKGIKTVQYTNTSLKGTLIPIKKGWIVLHINGEVSKSEGSIAAPSITGTVTCTNRHPILPIGVLILGPNNSEWDYPMVSTRVVDLGIFPLEDEIVEVPRVRDATTPIIWLACFVKQISMTSLLSRSNIVLLTDPSNLEVSLRETFFSKRFENLRTQWYTEEDKLAIVDVMRADIGKLLKNSTPKSLMDQYVVSWYNGSPSDAKSKITSVKGDFFEEGFDGVELTGETIVSKSNRCWKRCALTGLPIISIDINQSEDNQFVAYKELPILNHTKQANPIAEAIISSAIFCIYTGSLWK